MTEPKLNCPFCSVNIEPKIIEKLGTVVAIEDKNPVTKDHILVLPIRHTSDFFSMTLEEKKDADNLIRILRDRIEKSDLTVTGFNIGTNCRKSAGQTIMHAHIQLCSTEFPTRFRVTVFSSPLHTDDCQAVRMGERCHLNT